MAPMETAARSLSVATKGVSYLGWPLRLRSVSGSARRAPANATARSGLSA